MKLLDPADGAAKEAVEPVFVLPSGVVVADVAGTRAKAFEENESDREPSKSTSTLLDVAGAAEKKHKRYYHCRSLFKTINIKLKPQMTTN